MAYCNALETVRPDDVRCVELTTRSRGFEIRGRRCGRPCLMLLGEGGRGISEGTTSSPLTGDSC